MTLFDQAYNTNDIESMNRVAKILQNLREGRCCVRYLNSMNTLVSGNNNSNEADQQNLETIVQAKTVTDITSFETFLKKLTISIRKTSSTRSNSLSFMRKREGIQRQRQFMKVWSPKILKIFNTGLSWRQCMYLMISLIRPLIHIMCWKNPWV